jgi:hypothetical protein
MAATFTSLSIPYKPEVKNGISAVHLRRQLGEDLNAVGGSRRIYRSDDGKSRMTAANNKCMVFEQADTTNDPIAVEILQSADNRALSIDYSGADNSLILGIEPGGTSPETSGFYRDDTVTGNIVLKLGIAYLWVDATGDLRTLGTLPGSDTAGTVVGAMS